MALAACGAAATSAPWSSSCRKELQGLIARIATANPRWAAVRIQGELLALGYEVSAETVRCYRRRALRRPPSQSWRTFLANHRPQLWAADFFTVQTLTFKTLYVLFFITHARRRIVHFNVTAHPTAPWVWRQLLEATPWGQAAPLSDPGPRPLVRRCLHWQGASDRDQDGPHCGAGTEGERHRGACGGNAQVRMSRPSDHRE